jgi:hypothetical protein
MDEVHKPITTLCVMYINIARRKTKYLTDVERNVAVEVNANSTFWQALFNILRYSKY